MVPTLRSLSGPSVPSSNYVSNVCVTINPGRMTITVKECLDPAGKSPYARWFDALNAPAAAKRAWTAYKMAKTQPND